MKCRGSFDLDLEKFARIFECIKTLHYLPGRPVFANWIVTGQKLRRIHDKDCQNSIILTLNTNVSLELRVRLGTLDSFFIIAHFNEFRVS